VNSKNAQKTKVWKQTQFKNQLIKMKNLYKAVLLAALGLASVTAAQAQSDMLLGFNDAGGDVSADSAYQNDYVIDLGAISGFTATSTYSGSINQTTFDSAFVTPDSNWASEVAVGVAAENNAVSPKQIYVSSTSTPGSQSTSRFNNILSDASGIATGEYTTASGGSATTGWSYNVGVAPGNPAALNGNAFGNGAVIEQEGITGEEQFLSGGDATFNLYEAVSTGSTHAFTELGTFTIDANDGVDTISYSGINASVPEPTTYGIFAGAGLLLIALRRQFSVKNA
jgi:hypothetical protein